MDEIRAKRRVAMMLRDKLISGAGAAARSGHRRAAETTDRVAQSSLKLKDKGRPDLQPVE